jgi:hypothetical protein
VQVIDDSQLASLPEVIDDSQLASIKLPDSQNPRIPVYDGVLSFRDDLDAYHPKSADAQAITHEVSIQKDEDSLPLREIFQGYCGSSSDQGKLLWQKY